MMAHPPLTRLAMRARWRLLELQKGTGSPALESGPPVSAMGLLFPGPVGLAAGFDRHGRLLSRAESLGLGAVETGSVFAGAGCFVAPPPRTAVVRGVSLGMRSGRSWLRAEEHFIQAMREHGGRADYFCLNPGRDCPSPERLAAVIGALLASDVKRRPLMVKLTRLWPAPLAAASAWVAAGAAGLLVSAEGTAAPEEHLRTLRRALPPDIALVSVGGILTAGSALARQAAGADLVQIHRGMAQRGKALVQAINRAWPGGEKLRRPRIDR